MNHGNRVKFCVRVHQSGYSYDELKRIWTTADQLGYHSASLYDLLHIPTLECWTTLCALAAVTERIRLIPMVLANLYRPAPLLAKMGSTLDVISGGRLELGIGAGGGRSDHLAGGFPFPSVRERVAMLGEAVEVIKGLWTEPKLDYAGRYYTLQGASNDPRPVQQPRPPILIGGHGERYVLRSVARHADLCNIGHNMGLEEHRAKLDVLEGHCHDVGRDPSEIQVTHNTDVLIAEDGPALENLLGQCAARANRSVAEYRASLGNAIVGTPPECVEQIRRYVDSGINYFFLIFPHPVPSESLELFAREVMPHFEPIETDR
jgi:alkanesulfonate monooxygenase SsuD/methylene tetrahydromethanopterin reductase-like flavin-dependent oxidoreductase (luciferase family)